MITVKVQIKGVTSLLQNRFTETAEAGRPTRNIIVTRGTPREEATKCAYIDSKNQHWHPGAAFSRLLREAGGNHKLTGSRKSAKYVVPSAVLILNDAITLTNGDGKTPISGNKFEVDSRPVVIPATKGRIMKHRPRHDCWSATFSLRINEKILPVDFVHKLLVEGGEQIGVGDFRPEKGGPFGTFIVTSWEEVK